jgi:prepilin-type N-terminal cleavage/methylation domain-containing protein/prepilin-type processing-associated H-X9-DG protein
MCNSSRIKRGKHSAQAFTLVELLVVISIIALLLAILMPSLNAARERAKRVVCGSNLKQIGQGVLMYGSETNGKLPNLQPSCDNYPWRTYLAYQKEVSQSNKSVAYALGVLFESKIITNAKVFYCSNVRENGKKYEDNTQPGHQWPYTTASDGRIRVGYSFYPQNGSKKVLVDTSYARGFSVPAPATRQAELSANYAICCDVTSTYDTIAHKQKSEIGLNALFGDGHVRFCSDKALANKKLWYPEGEGRPAGPGNYPGNFRVLWSLLKP